MTFDKMKFYTVHEIAEKLQARVETIQKHIREGRLEAVKIGKGYRATEEQVAAYLKRQSTKGAI